MPKKIIEESITEMISIAKKWRSEQERDFIKSSGYVLIYQNEVTGWRNELRNPETEKPSVYAISIHDNVFITCGGNENDGAQAWISV